MQAVQGQQPEEDSDCDTKISKCRPETASKANNPKARLQTNKTKRITSIQSGPTKGQISCCRASWQSNPWRKEYHINQFNCNLWTINWMHNMRNINKIYWYIPHFYSVGIKILGTVKSSNALQERLMLYQPSTFSLDSVLFFPQFLCSLPHFFHLNEQFKWVHPQSF